MKALWWQCYYNKFGRRQDLIKHIFADAGIKTVWKLLADRGGSGKEQEIYLSAKAHILRKLKKKTHEYKCMKPLACAQM